MLSKAFAILSAALLVMATPAPVAVAEPKVEPLGVLASGSVTFCINANFAGACFSSNALTNSCVNFNGGLAVFNAAVSSVQVPSGIFCTLFNGFSCQGTAAFVSGNQANLANLNFNDMASSFICSVG